MQKQIVVRSLKVAAVVGTILVAINYGDKFYPLALASGDWVKIAMTYCVPLLCRDLFRGRRRWLLTKVE